MSDIVCKLPNGTLSWGREEILCVVGPTATGKTDLAIELSEQVGGEVISADSVQIYRGFDIGSGKPSVEQQQRVVHHLIGTNDPLCPVDAADFATQARLLIEQMRARDVVPIVCGGTFLWVRALIYGLARAPKSDPAVRAQLHERMMQVGTSAMHEQLARVDPATAARLHPNDWVRIERALEVFELTGKRLSDLHKQHQRQPPPFKSKLVAPSFVREHLDERIRKRADNWLQNGWIEEVQGLVEQGLRDTRPMGSVGYRQVLQYLNGQLAKQDLLDAIVRATRVFARRQRTWLRDEPVQWLVPEHATV